MSRQIGLQMEKQLFTLKTEISGPLTRMATIPKLFCQVIRRYAPAFRLMASQFSIFQTLTIRFITCMCLINPTKTITQITNYTDWNVGSPSYSMDGSKILFNLYRGDETQVYTAKSDGTDPLNLTNNVRSLSPRFGQDDKKIFYASYGTGSDSTLNIYVMSSNGTDVKALTTNGGSSPSWAVGFTAVSSVVPVPTIHLVMSPTLKTK